MQQIQQQQQSTVIADLLTPFCEAGSVNIREPHRTVRKRILVSLSFVDNEQLHEAVFKDQHIDWHGIQDYLQEITFTGRMSMIIFSSQISEEIILNFDAEIR